MTKRIFAILLSLFILIGGIAVYADAAPKLYIENTAAAAGSEVRVVVCVKNNPGFAAVSLEMAYDAARLTPKTVAGGAAIEYASVHSNIQQNNVQKTVNPITLFVVSPTDYTADGELFSLTFTVKPNAPAGDAELVLNCKEAANQSLEDVSFEVQNAVVNVKNDGTYGEAEEETYPEEPDVEPPVLEDAPLPENEEKPADNSTVEDKTSEDSEEKSEDLPAAETPDQKEEEHTATAEDEITVTIDGKPVAFDQPPILVNDRTLVPMRAIFESLGAIVDWQEETRTAIGRKDGVVIRIQIDNNLMMKNEDGIILDVPAQLVNSRTLVPIRAISEAFGCKVDWVEATKTVVILTK